jgi:murein DD-endopeptidase MepM/ murein hydrolase activator NlpD
MNGLTGLVLRVPVTDVPAGVVVSQFFGARPAAYKAYGLAGHEGIDYACPVGTTVVAAADGGVEYNRGTMTGKLAGGGTIGPVSIVIGGGGIRISWC